MDGSSGGGGGSEQYCDCVLGGVIDTVGVLMTKKINPINVL